MKVFIWRNVDELTDRYHDGGGVVIIAETVQRAEELIPYTGNGERMKRVVGPPDSVYTLVGTHEEKVDVFPDEGCC